jgi:hypothetical protein
MEDIVKFKGNGSIWNPAKSKILVNFNVDPVFETDDSKEIELLKMSGQAMPVQEWPEPVIEIEENDEPIKLGKKEIIEILVERGIDFNPRDKKEVLESLMYQE